MTARRISWMAFLLIARCAMGQSCLYDADNRLAEVRYDATHAIRYHYDLYDNLTNVTTAASLADEDADSDGLPDAWELVYFNLLTNTPAADPNADGVNNLTHFLNQTDPLAPDTDGDGAPNVEENLAGTDPTNAASCFEIMAMRQAAGTNRLVIQWQSVAGKRYRIGLSTNLVAQPPATWLKTNIMALPPLNTETDAAAGSISPRIYRIQLE